MNVVKDWCVCPYASNALIVCTSPRDTCWSGSIVWGSISEDPRIPGTMYVWPVDLIITWLADIHTCQCRCDDIPIRHLQHPTSQHCNIAVFLNTRRTEMIGTKVRWRCWQLYESSLYTYALTNLFFSSWHQHSSWHRHHITTIHNNIHECVLPFQKSVLLFIADGRHVTASCCTKYDSYRQIYIQVGVVELVFCFLLRRKTNEHSARKFKEFCGRKTIRKTLAVLSSQHSNAIGFCMV